MATGETPVLVPGRRHSLTSLPRHQLGLGQGPTVASLPPSSLPRKQQKGMKSPCLTNGTSKGSKPLTCPLQESIYCGEYLGDTVLCTPQNTSMGTCPRNHEHDTHSTCSRKPLLPTSSAFCVQSLPTDNPFPECQVQAFAPPCILTPGGANLSRVYLRRQVKRARASDPVLLTQYGADWPHGRS